MDEEEEDEENDEEEEEDEEENLRTALEAEQDQIDEEDLGKLSLSLGF